MEQVRSKIKRIKPVIKVKQSVLDDEIAVLAAIRRKKEEVVAEMKKKQKAYMEGVERLNKERASSDRSMLLTLERGLDIVKSKWYDLFLEVREIENQEKAQIAQLTAAKKNLASVEKLQERYHEQFSHELRKFDQKLTDEAAARQYITKGN